MSEWIECGNIEAYNQKLLGNEVEVLRGTGDAIISGYWEPQVDYNLKPDYRYRYKPREKSMDKISIKNLGKEQIEDLKEQIKKYEETDNPLGVKRGDLILVWDTEERTAIPALFRHYEKGRGQGPWYTQIMSGDVYSFYRHARKYHP